MTVLVITNPRLHDNPAVAGHARGTRVRNEDTVLHDEVVLLQVPQLPLHVCQLENECQNQREYLST